jgi:hypothetical protein
VERIPLGGWEGYKGHLRRYEWAAGWTEPGERVNDVACGIGYGATFFPHASVYRGYDKTSVPHEGFPGVFHGCDINDAEWEPEPCDVTCCFETLEHAEDPARLAKVLAGTTSRAIFVSVPVIPTVHCNQWHRTDFERDDIPPLFGEWVIAEQWPQPEETSHVWMFERG